MCFVGRPSPICNSALLLPGENATSADSPHLSGNSAHQVGDPCPDCLGRLMQWVTDQSCINLGHGHGFVAKECSDEQFRVAHASCDRAESPSGVVQGHVKGVHSLQVGGWTSAEHPPRSRPGSTAPTDPGVPGSPARAAGIPGRCQSGRLFDPDPFQGGWRRQSPWQHRSGCEGVGSRNRWKRHAHIHRILQSMMEGNQDSSGPAALPGSRVQEV